MDMRVMFSWFKRALTARFLVAQLVELVVFRVQRNAAGWSSS